LSAAGRRLDRGSGTAWAGEARDGAHGGADLTRWVRDDRHVSTATELIAAHCDRARVMPLLQGVPCRIHGWVAVDGVAALRPCETTLHAPDSPIPAKSNMVFCAAHSSTRTQDLGWCSTSMTLTSRSGRRAHLWSQLASTSPTPRSPNHSARTPQPAPSADRS